MRGAISTCSTGAVLRVGVRGPGGCAGAAEDRAGVEAKNLQGGRAAL